MSETSSRNSALPRFDPQRPGFLAEPYRVYDDYRIRDPVHWTGCPTRRRGGRWYVFDHRSAVTVLTDKRFCRQPATPSGCPAAPDRPNPGVPAFAELASGSFPDMVANWMLFQDPPRHTRLRATVTPLFTVSAAHALRARIEQRVQELINQLAPREQFDLIRDFAFPLPLDLIADVLGVDPGERNAFRGWSAALREAIDRPKWGTDVLTRAEVATSGLRASFEAAWRRHQIEPGPGVLGALFALEGKDEGLTKEEAFAMFTFLISAGHETTTNLIASGMYLFARYPSERERLRQEPGLITKAVEEILRFESPVQMAARTVAEDVDLAGRRLERGQRVEVLLGAANRDPAVFRAPEQFSIGRSPNPHLAFGVGSHYCVGAALGRLIGSIALPCLLERVRVMPEPDATNPWAESVGFRGLMRLPCGLVD